MEAYLIKSTACLLILFLFYKLVLENETMHRFKRFYLLGSILISVIIPWITFTTYVPALTASMPSVISDSVIVISSESKETTHYLPAILWTLYGIGVLFFSIRFFRNLKDLVLKIRNNPKVKQNNITTVLLQKEITPHTFFSYIFLNKRQFEAHTIPSEVLLHEQTHALQKHSIDILCIELIQIVFWFNPLVYFLKHAIKLNHEFLADQAVIQKGIKPNTYQNLLLAFSSNVTPLLANSINYSSIKKRFTVMKTKTSKRQALIRAFFLLPLVALLVFGFSTKETIQKKTTTTHSEQISSPNTPEKASPKQLAEYNKLARKYNAMDLENMVVKKKDMNRLHVIYNLMTTAQRKSAVAFPRFAPLPPAPDAPVVKKGVNDTDKNIPPPPPAPKTSGLQKATDAEIEIYNRLANKYKFATQNRMAVQKEEVNTLNLIYSKMTVSQQQKALPYPTFPPPPPGAFPAPDPAGYIIQMAKKGATFYIGNELITTEKAIEVIRENNSFQFEVKNENSKNPIVIFIGC
ncbi:M56 family metallopeptidase [Ulvibacter litoralis]|uniref:Signal transducer regulating beta-lactamase production, contains metallopeptidase domain n=1 Tax=Ulvibacter litoralis TaxID=227084 RepID=A0A1G7CJU4_9FLAO|nr:M56 family metallopeptidase [Ulvibacter litoralis]GHC47082.1 hypothetical protein GCM10008083_07760 [Ulvibacter litoralis]SDE39579.1 Signal transducer regulating beta-lactamase production, contains metallopeptidase domain [Ulvibacter litoralis]